MIATPTQAAEWKCPVARLWADEKVNPNCRTAQCPAWRRVPLAAGDPKFVAAVKAEQKRLADAAGKANSGAYHKTAVAAVMADRTAHGLPDKPTHGYCGLGGRVEA